MQNKTNYLKRIMKWATIAFILYMAVETVLCHTYLDFSQDYRQIDHYEGIVFKDDFAQTAYKRCFWGIEQVDDVTADFDRDNDGGFEGETYKTLTAAIHDTSHLHAWAASPDGTKIVYSEGRVIDETNPSYIRKVDFKVLDLRDNSITVIFTAPSSEYTIPLSLEWQ